MVKLEFTADERQRLHDERYHHPHPRVQRKMEALWLKSHGVVFLTWIRISIKCLQHIDYRAN